MAKEKERNGLADVGERYMEIYERNIPVSYHPANCPTEWLTELLEERTELQAEANRLKELLERISDILLEF